MGQFAPDRQIAGKAWDWVAASILGADDVLDAARARFLALLESGDVFRKFDAQLLDELAVVDWEWPWLDEWRQRFYELDLVPHMWRDDTYLYEGKRSWKDGVFPRSEGTAVALISHSAAMATYSLRNVTDGIGRGASSDRRLRLFALDDDVEGQVCRDISPTLYIDADALLPPYFPGDRTNVRWVTKRSAERFGWGW